MIPPVAEATTVVTTGRIQAAVMDLRSLLWAFMIKSGVVTQQAIERITSIHQRDQAAVTTD